MTPAHQTAGLAELVCSNSLKSQRTDHASGLLKEELTMLGCQLLQIARECAIPSGDALAVDRSHFSRLVEQAIWESGIQRITETISSIPEEWVEQDVVIIATGPLTTENLMNHLQEWLGEAQSYFFDAIAPILESNSLDQRFAFRANRHDNTTGTGDYWNCPLDESQYHKLVDALVQAERVEVRGFERSRLFERCQPVEEIARSGLDALRFGPMRPIGLYDPKTGKQPYAVVQLRSEDSSGRMVNMVGFQTRLKWSEQKRVFRMIPALHSAEFCRFGVMHRNAYIQSNGQFKLNFSHQTHPSLFFCGQISGVEGYVESIASGWYVGMQIDRRLRGLPAIELPEETLMGSLFRYLLTTPDAKPMYANFGLLPEIRAPKKEQRKKKATRALEALEQWIRLEPMNE